MTPEEKTNAQIARILANEIERREMGETTPKTDDLLAEFLRARPESELVRIALVFLLRRGLDPAE